MVQKVKVLASKLVSLICIPNTSMMEGEIRLSQAVLCKYVVVCLYAFLSAPA